jgi:hypothetical protein
MFEIYVDAACGPSKIGGWGLILSKDGKKLSEYVGGEVDCDKAKIEFIAADHAVQLCRGKTQQFKIFCAIQNEPLPNVTFEPIMANKFTLDLKDLIKLGQQFTEKKIIPAFGHRLKINRSIDGGLKRL